MWCIPKAGAEYVACMEDVLDQYEQPYDPKRPLVCFDEWLKQLIEETRIGKRAKTGQVERYDCELFTALGYKTSPQEDWRLIDLRFRWSGHYRIKFESDERPVEFQIDPECRIPQINLEDDCWIEGQKYIETRQVFLSVKTI